MFSIILNFIPIRHGFHLEKDWSYLIFPSLFTLNKITHENWSTLLLQIELLMKTKKKNLKNFLSKNKIETTLSFLFQSRWVKQLLPSPSLPTYLLCPLVSLLLQFYCSNISFWIFLHIVYPIAINLTKFKQSKSYYYYYYFGPRWRKKCQFNHWVQKFFPPIKL